MFINIFIPPRNTNAMRSLRLNREAVLAVETIVNKTIKKVSDGADGGVLGVNGSITAAGLIRVFHELEIDGREVVDLGAGVGRVVLSAMVRGASRATGFEHPENKAHEFVFSAAVKKIKDKFESASHGVDWGKATWYPRDIDEVTPMFPPSLFDCTVTVDFVENRLIIVQIDVQLADGGNPIWHNMRFRLLDRNAYRYTGTHSCPLRPVSIGRCCRCILRQKVAFARARCEPPSACNLLARSLSLFSHAHVRS